MTAPTLTDAGLRTPVLTVRTRPSHQVSSVAWSADDSIIAGGTADGNIDLWDRATGRELRTLRGHSGPITSLTFVGPNTLASGGRDATVRLWNILTGELLHTFPIGLTSGMGGVAIAVVVRIPPVRIKINAEPGIFEDRIAKNGNRVACDLAQKHAVAAVVGD